MRPCVEYNGGIIGWSGEVPKGWSKLKIKHVISDIKDGTHGVHERVEEGYPLLSAKNIYECGIHISQDESLISAESHEQITSNGFPAKNDLLLCCVGTIGRCCIYEYEYPLSFQRSVTFLRPKENIETMFLRYWIQSKHFQNMMLSYANTSAQSGIYMGTLKELPILLPDIDIQKRIIGFLESKTKKIDVCISHKQKLIDILREHRQSIIDEGITKGLGKNAELKDSGVKWIGEIPKDWRITKIKYTTYVKGRIGWQGLTSDEFIDEGPYLVTGTDIINGSVDWESCYHITEERYREAPPIQLKNGDILITKDGTIGKIAMVEGIPDKAILNSGLFVIRNLKEDYITKYLYWILKSKCFLDYIGYLETGSTIKHLYQETFENFSFPLPSKKQQKEIIEYIEIRVSKIDEIINDIYAQIDKFIEFKQSMIDEAVTGKVKI